MNVRQLYFWTLTFCSVLIGDVFSLDSKTLCMSDFDLDKAVIHCPPPNTFAKAESTTLRYRSTRDCGSPYYCIRSASISQCDGTAVCIIEVRRSSRSSECYKNAVEVNYGCVGDDIVSMCSGVGGVTLHPDKPTLLLSVTKNDHNSQGCDVTIQNPNKQWIEITPQNYNWDVVFRFCQRPNKAYLYLLKNHASGALFSYLQNTPECNSYQWQNVNLADIIKTDTDIEIHFPELTWNDDYELKLLVKAVDKSTTTTTTTTTTTHKPSSDGSSKSIQSQNDQNSESKSSAIIITVTVILCIAIISVGVIVAIYIYRHDLTKFNELFRPSRGLRRRQEVERNIYSAAHTGTRASDVLPQTPDPGMLMRSGSRSITGMRLPAIPPDEVDNTLNVAREDSISSRPPAPVPRETSPPPPDIVPLEAEENAHSVQLPIAAASPETEDSDSDDDKEYIPNHRFSMVKKAKEQRNSDERKSGEVQSDGEQLKYVAVDVIQEEPIHGTIAEVSRLTSSNDKNTQGAANIDESIENKMDYANIDKYKTVSLAQKMDEKSENENDADNPDSESEHGEVSEL